MKKDSTSWEQILYEIEERIFKYVTKSTKLEPFERQY